MIGLIMCGRKRQPRGVEFKDLGWEKDNEIIWLAVGGDVKIHWRQSPHSAASCSQMVQEEKYKHERKKREE